jgi:hypothetical protein
MNNQLKNPGFETASGTGPTVLQGPAIPGNSAAANWTVWNNSDATTTTDLLSSTLSEGQHMLHVCTTGPLCGLVQTFGATGTGPAKVTSAVWVFVVRGVVGMGVGDGGNTRLDVLSTTPGEWEQLQATNGVQPANEFIVYAADGNAAPEGACFYVDAAEVYEVKSDGDKESS